MSDENKAPETDQRSGGNDSQDRDRGDRPRRSSGPRSFYKKKICKVCANKLKLDYKEPETLRRFMTERGKILPRRITGTCAKHQRALAGEIKKARTIALLPFVAN